MHVVSVRKASYFGENLDESSVFGHNWGDFGVRTINAAACKLPASKVLTYPAQLLLEANYCP